MSSRVTRLLLKTIEHEQQLYITPFFLWLLYWSTFLGLSKKHPFDRHISWFAQQQSSWMYGVWSGRCNASKSTYQQDQRNTVIEKVMISHGMWGVHNFETPPDTSSYEFSWSSMMAFIMPAAPCTIRVFLAEFEQPKLQLPSCTRRQSCIPETLPSHGGQ